MKQIARIISIHAADTSGVCSMLYELGRSGPIGTVELVWLPEFTKFANKA